MSFWLEYLPYRQFVTAHYYGPPPELILIWMGCGIAAITGSALLGVSPKLLLAGGILVTVVSVLHVTFVALLFRGYALPYVFSAGVPRVAPGLLGLLGGVFAIWSASVSPRAWPAHAPPLKMA